MSRLKKGINDLATKSPKVALEWDYDKNYPLTPSDVCNSSSQQFWWKCSRGHTWQTSADARTQRKTARCPICTNQLVVKGCNDFATVYPQLLQSWDYEKNTVNPSEISSGYAESVWWICEQKHSWHTSIANRKKQGGCPYCRGRKILKGFNDVGTLYPDLATEWDDAKNTIDIGTIGAGSMRKVWWICDKGHHWDAAVASRVKGSGCSICANQKTLAGYNDFPTFFPELLLEWDYVKNQNISPTSYTAGSEQHAWWICKKGHSWKTMICSRTQGGGCPICAKEYKTSFPEQALFFYCRVYFPDCINGYTVEWLGKSEIDIYIPSLRIGIEYDGRVWHKSQAKDFEKNELCLAHDVSIIRLREPGIGRISPNDIVLQSLTRNDLETGIYQVLKKIGAQCSHINISQDIDEIYALMEFGEKEKSLSRHFPDIAAEWDYEKNSRYLSPETMNFNSKTKVWWTCPSGHSYQSKVESRTRMKSGCPYCVGKRVLVGYNDLFSLYPSIVAEWNHTKNTLKPTEVTPGSNKKVSWICSACGHEWTAMVHSRVSGHGCPKCATKKRVPYK